MIQQTIAVGGLSLVTAYLQQNGLITRENCYDVLVPCGSGPISKAAMLMSSVEFKIRTDPDLYFPKFTDALRQSGLGYLADELKQQGYLPPEHKRVPGTSTHRPTYTCKSQAWVILVIIKVLRLFFCYFFACACKVQWAHKSRCYVFVKACLLLFNKHSIITILNLELIGGR